MLLISSIICVLFIARDSADVAEQISRHLLAFEESHSEDRPATDDKSVKHISANAKAVLKCIKRYPGIKSADITQKTEFSLSTVERCLAELREQGVIEYVGSKKTGGYYPADAPKKS